MSESRKKNKNKSFLLEVSNKMLPCQLHDKQIQLCSVFPRRWSMQCQTCHCLWHSWFTLIKSTIERLLRAHPPTCKAPAAILAVINSLRTAWSLEVIYVGSVPNISLDCIARLCDLMCVGTGYFIHQHFCSGWTLNKMKNHYVQQNEAA